jgi:sporulation integral membrane protein YtvI
MNPQLERKLTHLINIVTTLLILIIVFFAIQYMLPLLLSVSGKLAWGFLPFILAVIIAILIDPLVDWLVQKRKVKRGVAVAISLLLVLIVIGLVIVFVVSRLVVELSALYGNLPYYTQFLMNYGLSTVEQIRTFLTNNPLPFEAQEALRANLQAVIDSLTALLAMATNFLFNLLTGLPGFATIIIISALATFFVSSDKSLITGAIYRFMPKKYVMPTSLVIGEINMALVGFFRAQTILISITAVLCMIGLAVLGSKYALTVGLIVGIFDLLPILGPGAILIPWALICILIGNYNLSVGILVLYGVLIGIRQLIEPKIIASSIGLHPLATLMALYLGLKFLGIPGFIIGPFLLILGKAILKSISDRK